MRIVIGFALVALLCFAVGSAFADKYEPNEKPWEYNYPPPRAVWPEVEPNNTCPGQSWACGDQINPAFLTAGEQDWYSFSANAGDEVTIGTDALNGSTTDTYLELYFECGGTMLASDDDSGPGLFSLIANFNVPQTGTYNVKVRGFSTSSSGAYIAFVNCVPGQSLPEDLCSGAIRLDPCASGNAVGDLTPYHNDYDPGSGGCASGYPEAGKDQVYVVDWQAGTIVHMEYLQYNYDTAFYVVTDCSNVPGSCVAGADDTFTGEVETIDYVVPASGTYYIILDAYGTNSGGPWSFNYTFNCGGALGACCVGETCTVTTQSGCPGEWQGEGTDCQPNPCIVIPVEESTWGAIKANYR